MSMIFTDWLSSGPMKDRAVITLSLPSELGYEKLIWSLVAWSAPRLQLPPARIADLQTALCEACINAIEHGNQGRPQLRVEITLVLAADYIEAVVRDQGVVRFSPSPTPAASIEQKLAGHAPARGMGLLLIQQLVDEANFIMDDSEPGNCFCLRMKR
jgi:serine/threonine-protein kinase RsbW